MNKKTSTISHLFSVVLFSFLVISSVDIFSQVIDPNVDQDPNLDQVPLFLRQGYHQQVLIDAPPVTIGGFDNYNMGTDFAEPHMSHNPLDPLEYFNAYNINGAHRTYEGHEWTFSAPSFGGAVAGDPITAYDGLGNLYYQNMMSPITGAKVIKSTNNGQSWGAAVIAISGGDKNWMACDQTTGPFANYIYTSMTNTGFTGHNFARSIDGGATFQQTFSQSNSPLPGAMVAVGPDVLGANNIDGGAVYFVTNSGNGFAATYTFFRSTDGGATFQLMSAQNFANYVGTNVNGRNSVQNMRTRPYPFIAADNSNGTYRGRLYLVYASNNPAGNGNKPDIYCRYSDDHGVTWSSPVVVNDDLNSQNNHQWHPSIWSDIQTGRLYVKWMDTRDTPTSDSAYIYASYSDDGGQTFVANQRISNAKMRINCTTCGGGGTPRYQGDYDAITSYGDVAMAVWTDFRNGSFGSYTGYFPDFAMFASPGVDSVGNNNDSTFYTVEVPSTTLYDLDAIFSATVTPTPASGTIQITFEPSNVLSTFPGSVQLRAKTLNFVTNGTYTITIEGKGPNGIPVHRRTVQLVVTDAIPVELVSFRATVGKDNIDLNWATATETNNRGFEIEKMYSKNGNTGNWEKVAFIDGNGTTTSFSTYNYSDRNINEAGKYSYRLKQIDFDGTFEYSNTIEAEILAPNKYNLAQNFPNPFNPSTKISYSIPQAGDVSIKIYSVVGEFVTTIVNEKQDAGTYEVEFDASSLTSGVYFYSIVSGEFSQTNKMILMK